MSAPQDWPTVGKGRVRGGDTAEFGKCVGVWAGVVRGGRRRIAGWDRDLRALTGG